jgi:regulator of replication initiation timing
MATRKKPLNTDLVQPEIDRVRAMNSELIGENNRLKEEIEKFGVHSRAMAFSLESSKDSVRRLMEEAGQQKTEVEQLTAMLQTLEEERNRLQVANDKLRTERDRQAHRETNHALGEMILKPSPFKPRNPFAELFDAIPPGGSLILHARDFTEF